MLWAVYIIMLNANTLLSMLVHIHRVIFWGTYQNYSTVCNICSYWCSPWEDLGMSGWRRAENVQISRMWWTSLDMKEVSHLRWCLFMMAQKFFMGLRSGLFPGQSFKLSTLQNSNLSLISLPLCTGAPTCLKTSLQQVSEQSLRRSHKSSKYLSLVTVTFFLNSASFLLML